MAEEHVASVDRRSVLSGLRSVVIKVGTNVLSRPSGEMALGAALTLAGLKLVSWLVALGSGTSGGTLAPLFTIGGGAGLALGAAAQALLPGAGVDVRVAAVVGMAALFAGASRAFLASSHSCCEP